MMQAAITLDEIDRLTGGRLGTFDVQCPLCGPHRREFTNQRRRVLRIWQIEPTFATFHCARCGEKGYAREQSAPPPDPVKLERVRREAAERARIAARQDEAAAAHRQQLALEIWQQAVSIAGTPAATYLASR